MEYGVIGEKLGHSFSKEIHSRFGDYDYEIAELAREDLAAFFRKRKFRGINVTIPYKKNVLPYCDKLDPIAEKIGAVNTIVNHGGLLVGYNTDYFGMRHAAAGIPLKNARVLILGTGGTAQMAGLLCRNEGAFSVRFVSRGKQGDGILSYEEAAVKGKDATILINATPVGMFPDDGSFPVDLSHFPACVGVIDAIYHPLRSNLVLDAMARQIPAVGGLAMLVAQGAASSGIFTGNPIPEEKIRAVTRELTREKENVVLIGMPGCGKSTVGALLAQKLGRPFKDVDAVVEDMAGCRVAELIKSRGETAFRQMEEKAVVALSSLTGCVIATGGGSVMQESNTKALKRNGKLVLLDRPLSELPITPTRPLVASREQLKALYARRYPRYCEVSDWIITATTPIETAENIERKWKE